MVRRFGSGAGSLQATERGRVFRGAPVQRPQGTPRDIAGEQRQAIQERLNNLNSQLQNLLRQQQENRIDGGSIRSRTLARKLQVQISGLSAEIQFLEQAKSSLQEGQAFQDITQVTELSQRANEEARRDVRRRQQNIKTPQEREEYARARQKEKQVKQVFDEGKEGTFSITSLDSRGSNITRTFTKEGQEIFLKSGIGLSPREYKIREKLINIGILKEKSTAFSIPADPITTVYSNQKIDNSLSLPTAQQSLISGVIRLEENPVKIQSKLQRKLIMPLSLAYSNLNSSINLYQDRLVNFFNSPEQKIYRLDVINAGQKGTAIYSTVVGVENRELNYIRRLYSNYLSNRQTAIKNVYEYSNYKLYTEPLKSWEINERKLNIKPIKNVADSTLGGFLIEPIKDIYRNPIKNVAFYTLSRGLGLTLGFTKNLIQKVPIKNLQNFLAFTGSSLILTPVFLNLYALKGQIKGSEGYKRGAILGIASKDFLISLKGFKAGEKDYLKLQGIVRTFGRQEISSNLVIAPEYFKGQKYPSARPGTRLSSLKEEFNIPTLPEEIKGKPYQFTASPSSFKSSDILAGSSEVPGLFGSPKLSPTFLKISTPKGYYPSTLNLFEGNVNPTALRTEILSLEYIPGRTGPNTRLPSGRYFPEFFKQEVGTGKTYLVGAKTEKEAITSVGSYIQITGKKFFFKFEGINIPIEQGKILPSSKNIGKNLVSLESIQTSYKEPSYSLAGLQSYKLNLNLTNLSFTEYSSYKIYNSRISSLNKILSSSIVNSKGPYYSSKKSYKSSLSSLPSIIYSRISSSSSSSSKISNSIYSVSSSKKSKSSVLSSSSRSYPKDISSFKYKLPKPSTTTRGLGLFSVQVRRRGKFRTVGLAETQEKAFEIGRNIVSKTLGATFKVSGKGVSIKTPKGFYTKKDKKEGVLLIEQPKYRLSTVTEISEIQRSRKRR